MPTTLITRPVRARTVGVAWFALSALAIAVFAPLRYLLHSVPDLAATGEDVARHYAAQRRAINAASASPSSPPVAAHVRSASGGP